MRLVVNHTVELKTRLRATGVVLALGQTRTFRSAKAPSCIYQCRAGGKPDRQGPWVIQSGRQLALIQHIKSSKRFDSGSFVVIRILYYHIMQRQLCVHKNRRLCPQKSDVCVLKKHLLRSKMHALRVDPPSEEQ